MLASCGLIAAVTPYSGPDRGCCNPPSFKSNAVFLLGWCRILHIYMVRFVSRLWAQCGLSSIYRQCVYLLLQYEYVLTGKRFMFTKLYLLVK